MVYTIGMNKLSISILSSLILFVPLIVTAQVATTTQPEQVSYPGYPELKVSADGSGFNAPNVRAILNWYNPFRVKAPIYGLAVRFTSRQNTGTFGKNDQFVIDCNNDGIPDYSVHYTGETQFAVAGACSYTKPGTYIVQGTVLTNVTNDYSSPYAYDNTYRNNYISKNCPSGCYAKATVIITASSSPKQTATAALSFTGVWNVFKSFLNLFKI